MEKALKVDVPALERRLAWDTLTQMDEVVRMRPKPTSLLGTFWELLVHKGHNYTVLKSDGTPAPRTRPITPQSLEDLGDGRWYLNTGQVQFDRIYSADSLQAAVDSPNVYADLYDAYLRAGLRYKAQGIMNKAFDIYVGNAKAADRIAAHLTMMRHDDEAATWHANYLEWTNADLFIDDDIDGGQTESDFTDPPPVSRYQMTVELLRAQGRHKEALRIIDLYFQRTSDRDYILLLQGAIIKATMMGVLGMHPTSKGKGKDTEQEKEEESEEVALFREAVQLLDEAIPKIPKIHKLLAPTVKLLIAEALDACGRPMEAEWWYEEVILSDKLLSATPYRRLSAIYHAKGDVEGARGFAELAEKVELIRAKQLVNAEKENKEKLDALRRHDTITNPPAF
jgi:tetratricopeptide (TPR) repeat protein